MKKAIWKYEVLIKESFSLDLPEGAEVLSVQVQYKKPYMWIELIPGEKHTTRAFKIVGTGHQKITDNMKHIGTFQMFPYVWHLYEELP